jgi:hypothetical protein
MKGAEMARGHEEEHERRAEETERTRSEVVNLLRDLLKEARGQAHGPIVVSTLDEVIALYSQIENQIELKTCPDSGPVMQ